MKIDIEIIITVIICVAMLILALVLRGYYVAKMAKKYGYDPDEWFALGMFDHRLATHELLKSGRRKYSSKITPSEFKETWECSKCGTVNPKYKKICSCGNARDEIDNVTESVYDNSENNNDGN